MSKNNEKPLIAVTMGDPAGIGPELCLKVLNNDHPSCNLAVFGSKNILDNVAKQTNMSIPDVPTITIENLLAQKPAGSVIVDLPGSLDFVKPGICSPKCGLAAYNYIEMSIKACLKKQVDGVCTGPINKESLNMAGIQFPGHTEIFAKLTDTSRYCMMLTSQKISVSFITTHTSYLKVPSKLNIERVSDVIELTWQAINKFKKDGVKLAVCGLNPHAGENGLFGLEEMEIVTPAIENAQKNGISIDGPLSPDAAFTEQIRKKYDTIICMYHDQGHIPFKMLSFEDGVNITLGLPIIRTSVDHGTAFDIAWKGVAQETSLEHAIDLAVKLTGKSRC